MIKVIILDFDGVVVESNSIKHNAFSELFQEYPEHHDRIMQYHFAHNHVNRHAKFKYITEKILKQKYTQRMGKKLAARFSGLTREKIINCPFVEGALDFIQHFYKKNPLYIASATPLDELRVILRSRELLGYFKSIYGAPISKAKMFSEIIRKENVSPDEVLFIGDSPEDYKVAQEVGIHFLARGDRKTFTEAWVKCFRSMSEIKSYLLNGGFNELLKQVISA
jgi:HAD superfamily hydrolase (TIGR01549 family)